jgi:hypothetical protein
MGQKIHHINMIGFSLCHVNILIQLISAVVMFAIIDIVMTSMREHLYNCIYIASWLGGATATANNSLAFNSWLTSQQVFYFICIYSTRQIHRSNPNPENTGANCAPPYETPNPGRLWYSLDRTRVCSDSNDSITEMQCLRPLRHTGTLETGVSCTPNILGGTKYNRWGGPEGLGPQL